MSLTIEVYRTEVLLESFFVYRAQKTYEEDLNETDWTAQIGRIIKQFAPRKGFFFISGHLKRVFRRNF